MISKVYILIIVLIAGSGLIWYGFFNPKNNEDINNDMVIIETVTPTVSSSQIPVPTPRPKPVQGGQNDQDTLPGYDINLVQSPVPRELITGPSTCQLSGSISFLNNNIYETKGAKLAYQNIDDSSRLIFWKITPDDGSLKAGPNIFANIRPLPNGETMVGVTPDDKFTSKEYTLTAYVTYGVHQPDGSEKIANANCTGQITVSAP